MNVFLEVSVNLRVYSIFRLIGVLSADSCSAIFAFKFVSRKVISLAKATSLRMANGFAPLLRRYPAKSLKLFNVHVHHVVQHRFSKYFIFLIKILMAQKKIDPLRPGHPYSTLSLYHRPYPFPIYWVSLKNFFFENILFWFLICVPWLAYEFRSSAYHIYNMVRAEYRLS